MNKLVSIRNVFALRFFNKKCIDFFRKINGIEYVSYSQNFEDLIIQRLTKNQRNGFYVDVGAHNPLYYSNTFLLHKNGWRGINIDPLPNCMKLFSKYRKTDVNLNVGVSSLRGKVNYYNFEIPAYNTIDEEQAEGIIKNNISRLIEKITVEVMPLCEIFDSYLGNQKIDFLNIDVEKREMDVLSSNNWIAYRPRFICIESLNTELTDLDVLKTEEPVKYLIEQNYIIVAKVGLAIFFMDTK